MQSFSSFRIILALSSDEGLILTINWWLLMLMVGVVSACGLQSLPSCHWQPSTCYPVDPFLLGGVSILFPLLQYLDWRQFPFQRFNRQIHFTSLTKSVTLCFCSWHFGLASLLHVPHHNLLDSIELLFKQNGKRKLVIMIVTGPSPRCLWAWRWWWWLHCWCPGLLWLFSSVHCWSCPVQ